VRCLAWCRVMSMESGCPVFRRYSPLASGGWNAVPSSDASLAMNGTSCTHTVHDIQTDFRRIIGNICLRSQTRTSFCQLK
jgi:hypothetical protein